MSKQQDTSSRDHAHAASGGQGDPALAITTAEFSDLLTALEQCAGSPRDGRHSVSLKPHHARALLEALLKPARFWPTVNFTDALKIAQRGFAEWASKPHNARWFRRIDGTPIPNDLVVCIANAFAETLRADDKPAAAGWQPMETVPADERVLVNFRGAGPIVAYRDPKFPEMWVRYLGFGKSALWPLVNDDYAIAWMPLPDGTGGDPSPPVIASEGSRELNNTPDETEASKTGSIMDSEMWTVGDALRLWRYNWIKRPWRNFLWRYRLSRDVRDLARAEPDNIYLRPGLGALGKMTRANMLWARHASLADGAPPNPSKP